MTIDHHMVLYGEFPSERNRQEIREGWSKGWINMDCYGHLKCVACNGKAIDDNHLETTKHNRSVLSFLMKAGELPAMLVTEPEPSETPTS